MQFRLNHRMLLLSASVLSLTTLAYKFSVNVWQIPVPKDQHWLFRLAILIGVLCWTLYVWERQPQRRHRVSATLWQCILLGALAIGFGFSPYLVYTDGTFLFRDEPDLARSFTLFRTQVIAWMNVGFAAYLLYCIRNWILYKPSKTALRNWYITLALFAITVCLGAFEPETGIDFSPLTLIAIALSMGMMLLQSLRMNWVVYLDFREKSFNLGLSAALVGLLVVGFFENTGLGFFENKASMSRLLDPSANIMILLSYIFGILYCTTMFLSLMFHLPTTNAYQKSRDQVAALQSFNRFENQLFDKQKLLSTVAESISQGEQIEKVWIALPDEASGGIKPKTVVIHPPNADISAFDQDALFKGVQNQGGVMVLNTAAADLRIKSDFYGSLAVIPLQRAKRFMGAVFIANAIPNAFEQEDIQALEIFIGQAAMVLENAMLFEETVEKERLQKELDIARDVQQKLLPATFPQISGLEIAASEEFASEVGGDYFDFVSLDAHRFAFIIADVSGHGASAAFHMAEMRGIFQALAPHFPPASLLTQAQQVLIKSLDRKRFISAICGIWDGNRAEVHFARAGHPPPLHCRLDQPPIFLRQGGVGLGVLRDPTKSLGLQDFRCPLQAGDVFVLYTDGVTESRDAAGTEYGYERLAEFVQTHRYQSAQEIHDGLLQSLRTFTNKEKVGDDLTLVVFKWHGIRTG